MRLKRRFSPFKWFVGLSLCIFIQSNAQQPVPCLIFTGHAETEQYFDLAKQNKIFFAIDGMTVGSSKDYQTDETYLPYSEYHHFKIGLGIPQTTSKIGEISIDGTSRLIFQPESKSILLESTSDLPYSISIYNSSGILTAASRIHPGQSFTVASLTHGMYIGVATDGNDKLVLKFIIK